MSFVTLTILVFIFNAVCADISPKRRRLLIGGVSFDDIIETGEDLFNEGADLVETIEDETNDIIDDTEDIINDTEDITNDIINDTGDLIEGIPETYIPPPDELIPAEVGTFVAGVTTDTVEFVESSANEVSDWTEGAATDVSDWTAETANDVAEFTVTAVEETGEWIVNAANDIVSWIEDAIECIVSIFESYTDACVLQAMEDATNSCFLGNGPCRLEIDEANGRKCIGISDEWSVEETQTFFDEAEESDHFAAGGTVELSAIARAEASVYAEAGMTISNQPQVDAKFFPPRLSLDAEVRLDLAAEFSATVEKRIELAEKRKVFRKIFMLGSIPVLVEGFAQPVAIAAIEGVLSAEGSVAYRVNGWIDFGEPIEMAVRLDTGVVTVSDWEPSFLPSFDDSWEYDISGAAELTVSAKVGVELTVTIDKLVEAMAFPHVLASIGITAEIGTCSGGQVAIEANMGVSLALEAEIGLNDFEMRRRQLISFTTINLFDVMTDMCEELEEELECGSFMTTGCEGITEIFSFLGWNGDIPIPDNLSFDIVSFDIPILSTTIPITECAEASESSSADEASPTIVSIPPPADVITFEIRGKDGSEIVQITDDNGWVFDVPISTTYTEWTAPSNKININFLNDHGSVRDVYFQSDRNVQITFPSLWAPWNCGSATENSRCGVVRSGRFLWSGMYVVTFQSPPPCPSQFQMTGQASHYQEECQSTCPEDCMQRWHVDNGAQQLQCGPLCENSGTLFNVKCHSADNGGYWLEGIWEGPKHSTFDIARVTADNFDTFAAHPVCGHSVTSCMDTYAMYSYYVRASNGDCVLTLNCHNAGYSGLESTEVAKWDVRIYSGFCLIQWGGDCWSYFSHTYKEVWWGAPDTTFSLQRMTADNYEAFLNHPVCGSTVQVWAESTYYVQASNGDCVMALMGLDGGYSNLRASHMTTDWQVSVYSDSQSHTFSQPWKGLEDSSFAIQQVTEQNFQKFSQHPYCGYGVQRCYDEGYGYAFYVASDDGDCVMTLNCNNPGYSNLHAVRTANWLVSATSSLGFFERVWKGPVASSFRFAQVTDAMYDAIITDQHCGDAIRECKESEDSLAYFVEASDGSCVMTLDCFDSGYTHLNAIRQD